MRQGLIPALYIFTVDINIDFVKLRNSYSQLNAITFCTHWLIFEGSYPIGSTCTLKPGNLSGPDIVSLVVSMICQLHVPLRTVDVLATLSGL